MEAANIQSYYTMATIMAVKSFIVQDMDAKQVHNFALQPWVEDVDLKFCTIFCFVQY
jgi:hypothetical protein